MGIIFTAERVEPTEWERDGGVPPGHGERLDLGKDWSVLFRVLNFGEDFANPALAEPSYMVLVELLERSVEAVAAWAQEKRLTDLPIQELRELTAALSADPT